ncbi:MAG: riboflavin synthase [Alphaproteobacteria bacterium]|nr:riboflavin synthase [Alphaproteobacteria bacterium]
MFTGIITAIGTVRSMQPKDGGGARVVIATPWDCTSIDLGASIACNGCCLTVVERDASSFSVDVSEESLAVTSLKDWREGEAVNLERALSMGDELGGHIVSGHVDGLAEILSIARDGDSYRVKFKAPDHLAPMIAPKGSVTLDGISLTVNEVDGADFGIMVIPHTWSHTTLGKKQVGDKINLEADMLARYVARIMSFQSNPQDPS